MSHFWEKGVFNYSNSQRRLIEQRNNGIVNLGNKVAKNVDFNVRNSLKFGKLSRKVLLVRKLKGNANGYREFDNQIIRLFQTFSSTGRWFGKWFVSVMSSSTHMNASWWTLFGFNFVSNTSVNKRTKHNQRTNVSFVALIRVGECWNYLTVQVLL